MQHLRFVLARRWRARAQSAPSFSATPSSTTTLTSGHEAHFLVSTGLREPTCPLSVLGTSSCDSRNASARPGGLSVRRRCVRVQPLKRASGLATALPGKHLERGGMGRSMEGLHRRRSFTAAITGVALVVVTAVLTAPTGRAQTPGPSESGPTGPTGATGATGEVVAIAEPIGGSSSNRGESRGSCVRR